MASYEDLQSQIEALRAEISKPKRAPRKKVVEEEAVYEAPARKAPAPRPAKQVAPRATHPSEMDDRIISPRFDASIRLRDPKLPVRATVTHKCNCPDCPHKN